MQSEVAALQIHHIDESPSNNDTDNLILVCASCHAKITARVLSFADVVTKKRELYWRSNTPQVAASPSVAVSIAGSTFKGDIAQNIIKISTPKKPRIAHPSGSLGADLERRAYIDYLIRQYYQYRKADASYGRRVSFSHAVLHTNIERRFGFKTFFMPASLFEQLSIYLKELIDQTIQGKRNSANGSRNYHSYEEHLANPMLSGK